MKNKILIVLLCWITTLGYAQEVDELLQATSAIEMLDGTTRASSSNATSQATLRCVQVIKPEVSAILQQVCRMQDLIEIIIEDLGDVSISDELIISQLAAICSKIENININVSIGDVALTAVCDLDPVISAIDNTEQVLCSKLELIESQLDNLSVSACDVNLDPVLTAIDNSEQILCSKLEIIDSKLDNLNISLSCDFDPVITAIDESEQILCSKLEIIDSKLDVLNLSHIEVVVGPITFTIGDLTITAICDFTSVLDAISESDALLCSKLEIIESILEVPSCATTPITGPTTITAEGSYCVADTINGAIEVNANNVTIDLNGYHITGSIIIDDGVEYPYIFGPGTIDGGSPAIYVAGSVLGVKNLRLSDLTVRNGSVGIALENVFGGHISNVEMTQNNTGIELTNSYNITIQDSVATSNSNAGYSLISSFTNCIRNSKAVGTGYGNSNSNDTIFGFVSQNGGCNIFENSIANGTQGANITDFNALVAGFALRGSESCSKIIGSESANAITSANGVTIPYGILLEGSLGSALTLTAYPPVPAPGGERVLTIEWSPDQKLLAVGTDSGDGNVVIGLYSVDNTDKTVSLIATPDLVPTATVNSISWHPSGQFIAAGIDTDDAYKVRVYEYCSNNNSLKQVAMPNIIPGGDVTSVDWSPNGKYLAVGGSDDVVRIYAFDAVEYKLTQIITVSVTSFQKLEWHPSGRFLGVVMSSNFYVYGFNSGSSSLTVAATQPAPNQFLNMLSWTADGKYLALVDFVDSGEDQTYTIATFLFNGQSLTSGATNAGISSVRDLDWSSDGRYLAAIVGSALQAFPFDRTGSTSFGSPVIQNMGITNESEITLNWSPDGQYIAVGLQCLAPGHGESCVTIGIAFYEALSFPHKNVITNNTVYCNSGNMCPGGVGISGSSIANMIIGNTAYANPVPQQVNEPFVQTNYEFVTNIFNQLFGQAPSDVQNISIDACEPICAPTDLALIAKQIKYKVEVIESKIDNLSVSASASSPCAPTAITAPTTITAEGVYCVANTIAGEIEINGSDIVVDLNGYDIQGGIDILAGSDNITILNGTVSGASDAIRAENATNITLENVTARNATVGGGEEGVGIHFINVVGGLIKNCEMTQNITGLEFNNSYKIVVDHSVATGNTYAGFSLVSSSTNCLRDCKAVDTGSNNTQVLNNGVFGFVSKDGHSNIFERCIANATQALSTTDYNSVIAGFALRGDEKCTKIIDSEAANSTTGPDGVTVPYGILLEAQIDANLTLTAVPTIPSTSSNAGRRNSWSPDGKYIAIANNTNLAIEIYELNYNRLTLAKIAEQAIDTTQIWSIAWSPDGSQILLKDLTNFVYILKFDRKTNSLSTELSFDSGNSTLTQVAWMPDQRHIVITGKPSATTTEGFSIYAYDSITQTVSFVAETTTPDTLLNDFDVSPDGRFIAIAPIFTVSDTTIRVYLFENNTLIDVADNDPSPSGYRASVRWSPDGKYLLSTDQANMVRIFSFDPETYDFNVVAETNTSDAGERGISSWSPDGRYVAIGSGNKLTVFFFDRGALDLIFVGEQTVLSGSGSIVASWSPDGQFIGVSNLFLSLGLQLYQVLSFPSKNVITNNTVYCNSGGNCPSGVGISGSSIKNLIIGNTAYSNPVPQSANHPIVGSNYYFVTNVFNQLFGQAPSDLQNISVDGCAPICTPTDLALLAQQIKYKVCVPIPSQLDVIESKIDLLGSPCTPTAITAPTTITAEGVYCVANTIAGEIEINGDDIVIDLNGYDIQGGIDILAGSDNITILNGTVSGSSDAIRAEGVTNITLENVTARNATIGGGEEGVGIHFINVVGGLIKNCEMTQNITGLEFNNTYKIVVDHSVATGNTYAGFSLVSSSTNCLRDCKAVDTGSNNTQVLNNGVFGFVSKDGHSNIFERCIANATQALSTTDSQSVVAGFALRGDEKCTKIIDSESANATTSPDGVTVPYGILLEAQFDALVTVTQETTTGAGEVVWSPDGKYVAVAEGINNILIYEFDRESQVLIKLSATPTGAGVPRSIAWSADGNYLAVALLTGDMINVYEFDSFTGSLTKIANQPEVIDDPSSVAWSPNGQFLAAALRISDRVTIYEFNKVAGTLTKVSDQPDSIDRPVSVSWSPDGNYVAAAIANSGRFTVYGFDRFTKTLVSLPLASQSASTPQAVYWSPDGKYLAAPQVLLMRVYEFDRETESLNLFAEESTTQTPVAAAWSPDGQYLTAAILISNKIGMYFFDASSRDLILLDEETVTTPFKLAWSPDGQYTAVATLSTNLVKVYNTLTFPSKNIITNNTVYCNSGGNCPSGVGISGSSIQNLIIGNTAYSNPVPQSANHPIVGSNYYFVTNVFNQLFGQAPSDLQNISVDGCAPICTPTDLALLAQQIKYKVCVPIPSQLDVIESKIDAISFVCDLQPVLNAVSQTEAVLCSKLEIIDSQLDVVESKIDILPFGATQIDIAISTQIDINASLQEVIDVIQSGDEILCSKLEVIEQKIDNITSSAMASPCAPTAITAPTTITAEGVYCVANTIAGEIEINGSDIVVDLNGYDIQGGIDILAGSDNITILNGTVSGASDAIHVEGATNITLENVTARNATAGGGEHGVGIHFVNVLGGLIKNCEMTQNLTGLEFNNSHNITVDHSIATANSYAGFSLISSFTNCFRDCKSISTGAGNNQTSGNIFGFVSRNGGCNIFENSIANGTQGLGITDCNALVAGFALRGSESCSKIINSESANTTTNPNGLTIPYGILLEDVFDVPNPNYPDPDFITGEFLITLTAVPVIPTPSADVQAVQWRPDQKYFAAGYDSAVSVYSFNSVTYVASKVADGAAAPTGTVTHLDWSPDGKYLAVGTTSGVFVYEFCTLNCTLKLVNTVSLANVSSVDWHPTAKYLAVATNDPDVAEVYVYTFDRVAQSLTQLFTPALSTTNPVNDVQWSPDGNYLAVVDSDNSANSDLFVYGFNKNNAQLALVSSVGLGTINVHAVAWRFDGKYIAVGGDQSLRVLEVNNGAIDPTPWGYLQEDTIYSLDWSSNGKYIVIGTDASATAMPDYMQVIQFDPCQEKGIPCDALVLIAVPDIPPTGTAYEAINSIDWSPDGQFILAGTDDNNLRIAIYDALSFPMKNVIKNNTVYCNSGGSCPSGIGISGSSVANMIIGNTAYSNPVHPPVIGSNYVFVTNVFDQLFGQAPTDLQNISVDGCQAICQPEDPILLLKQIKAIVTDLSLGDINISSCDFTQVINAIDQSEQVLCSKIENIPFGFTSVDINLNTMFEAQVSGLDGIYSAIDQVEQTLCSKFEVIESKLDVTVLQTTDCSARITTPTTLTVAGVYCVANDIDGEIVIACDGIVVRGNGYSVRRIAMLPPAECPINNGEVDDVVVPAASPAFTADATFAPINNIRLRNIVARNGDMGIGLKGVKRAIIQNCDLYQNHTGLELINCDSVVVENCRSTQSVQTGFCLNNSTNCIFKNCDALSTGSGNMNTANNNIFGFVANSGMRNKFIDCNVIDTQGMAITDFNSTVAGFALCGSENSSTIQRCQVIDSMIGTSTGIPYGFYLEPQFDVLTSLTASTFSGGSSAIFALEWSPDGKYVITGGIFGANSDPDIRLYKYTRPDTLQLIDVQDPGLSGTNNVKDVKWSPSGNFVAACGTLTGNDMVLYSFNSTTEKLTQISSIPPVPGDAYFSVAWSPDERYLLLGSQTAANELILYRFNSTSILLEQVDSTSIDALRKIDWSPDCIHIAIAPNVVGDAIVTYEFDRTQETLINRKEYNIFAFASRDVQWSPDGKFVAVAGRDAGAADGALIIYQLDAVSGNLIKLVSATPSGATLGDYEAQSVAWSPDGLLVALVGYDVTPPGAEDVTVFKFDRSAITLTQIGSFNPDGGPTDDFVQRVDWSPDAEFLAVGKSSGSGDDQLIYILRALNFPQNNMITECSFAGMQSSSVGFAGSSGCNSFIKNFAQNNTLSTIDPCVNTNYVGVTNANDGRFGFSTQSTGENTSNMAQQPPARPQNVGQMVSQTQNKVSGNADVQTPLLAGQVRGMAQTIVQSMTNPTDKVIVIDKPGDYAPTDETGNLSRVFILSSCVRYNHNNKVINGGIMVCPLTAGTMLEDVEISNANFVGSSPAVEAIDVVNFRARNIVARDGDAGIRLSNVNYGLIDNCDLRSNYTGVALENCSNIVVQNTRAVNSICRGFDLVNSSTCCISDCKALSTGFNNSLITDNEVFGFVSTNGHSNIFERCIANATQALSTTDSNSVVAGFALRGNESCTKIIDSESANSTTSPDGMTVPYGILLEAQFDGLVTITNSVDITPTGTFTTFLACDWSPDGKYIIAGGGLNEEYHGTTSDLYLYSFNWQNKSLQVVDTVDVGPNFISPYFSTEGPDIRTVKWSLDGNYVAVAGVIENYNLHIYALDRTNQKLTLVDQVAVDSGDQSIREVAWSPDGRFLVVAARNNGLTPPQNDVFLYEFDRVTQSLALKFSDDPISVPNGLRGVDWSPDGNYVAFCTVADPRVLIYRFDPASKQLILVDSPTTTTSDFRIKWSPNGKYLAIAGNEYTAEDDDILIYEFDRVSEIMGAAPLVQSSLGMSSNDLSLGLDWSPDGCYLVVGGGDNTSGDAILSIFKFDSGTPDLLLLSSEVVSQAGAFIDIRDLSWSPDGSYIASATTRRINDTEDTTLVIYSGLSFPSKNVIKGNTVYCNSGGSCPSGVGISGSSIQNMIIGNTAYSNPVPQSANHPIVESNYYFVTNVFNQLFGTIPSDLQNISLNGCEPICSPEDTNLLIKQTKAKVCDVQSQLDVIESKVDFNTFLLGSLVDNLL